jgi:hypothetical protein
MSSAYDDLERPEILALVARYNNVHCHKDNIIRIMNVSYADFVAVKPLLEQKESPVVHQISRVIKDLSYISKRLQSRDPKGRETTLSTDDRAEITASVKKLLDQTERKQNKFDVEARKSVDVAAKEQDTARWVRDNQIAGLHSRAEAKQLGDPRKGQLKGTQQTGHIIDCKQAIAHLEAEKLASQIKKYTMNDGLD